MRLLIALIRWNSSVWDLARELHHRQSLRSFAKRMAKGQQMRWNRWTVQPFLAVRTAVLNETLSESSRGWFVEAILFQQISKGALQSLLSGGIHAC